jgi:putative transposase
MRYAQGGGLSAAERAARERVRVAAAWMLAGGASVVEVAGHFRVTTMSVSRWRRGFAAGGEEGLASKGSGGAECKLTDAQLELLQVELDAGPAVHGWPDQRWTLARIRDVIAARFKVDYTVGGVGYLLHRIGWCVQVPTRRAVERDERDIAAWRDEQWPVIKQWRRAPTRGCASRMKPDRA